jgi:hypothetical protein
MARTFYDHPGIGATFREAQTVMGQLGANANDVTAVFATLVQAGLAEWRGDKLYATSRLAEMVQQAEQGGA